MEKVVRQLNPRHPLPEDATLAEYEAWLAAGAHEALKDRIQTWHSDGYINLPYEDWLKGGAERPPMTIIKADQSPDSA